MSIEPSVEMLLSPTTPEMEVESSPISNEIEAESSDTQANAPSAEKRVESYRLPLNLRTELSQMTPEEWREQFTCLPLLHPAILALRFPIPESYRAHCPSSVGIATEEGIFENWVGLFHSMPNPLPKTEETDGLSNHHGHFVSNVRRLRVLSDHIKHTENGGVLQVEKEDGDMSTLPGTPKTAGFIQCCLERAEAVLEEMVVLLVNIDQTTQKVKYLADKEAYRAHQRNVASEAEEPDYRDHRDIHPSILNLECAIPQSYQPHFTQEHSAKGIIDHYIHFVGHTPEPRGYEHEARVCWRNYKEYEARIRAQKNKLFILSDALNELDDPRFWLYGENDQAPPPPQELKEDFILEYLDQTEEILLAIVALFPSTREAALRVHRAYEVEQNRPFFGRAPMRYVPPAQSAHERRRQQGLLRQRLSREADRREEVENESPYLVALGLRQRYIDWHAGRGPNPNLVLLYPHRYRQAEDGNEVEEGDVEI